MKVIVLHLSDIHIRNGNNHVLSKVNGIANVLNICTHDEECTCFLVVSGDIAYSGDPEEYKIAYKFIDNLRNEISINRKVINVFPILVPGNHDCNFNNVKSTRASLIDHLHQADDPYIHISSDLIDELTCIQNDYFDFLQKIDAGYHSDNRIYWLHNYEIDKYNIRFLCLNTAWMSTKKCKSSGEMGQL